MTLRARAILWPSLMTGIMLIGLLGLGTWQVQRLLWKQDVLARFAVAAASPPIPLDLSPEPYAKVVVTGRFRHDLAVRFGAVVQESRMGTRLIVPLERDGGPPVLVDRGWVPSEKTVKVDEPTEPVSVIGFIHPPDRAGLFSATDDLAARQFYTMNPTAMAGSVGLSSVAPFILVAIGPTPAAKWPDPARQLPQPPNNHLAYAITWYGLAISLVAIFIVWLRKGTRP